jgi:hypothetical protein
VAESVVVGLRSAAVCGLCGRPINADLSKPATFCPECGCCLLAIQRGGGGAAELLPLVPPRVGADAAWSKLSESALPGLRAERTAARLLFVPFHEWAPDLSRTRVVRDARALLAPAADLLPAGFHAPDSTLGDDRRGLAIAETAHKGRLADPASTLDLIRQGEAVDVMVPRPGTPPEGADPGAPPRLLCYPFWFVTYRVDWTERRGVVDAVTGEPVGPSSTPRRWRPAVSASLAGLATFAILSIPLAPMGMPAVQATVAGAGSWVAAAVTLANLLRKERGR